MGIVIFGFSHIKSDNLHWEGLLSFNTFGNTILVLFFAFAGFENVTGDVLLRPHLLFAGANGGVFPKFLAQVHPRFTTPYWAIITYGALIFILSISGEFKQAGESNSRNTYHQFWQHDNQPKNNTYSTIIKQIQVIFRNWHIFYE